VYACTELTQSVSYPGRTVRTVNERKLLIQLFRGATKNVSFKDMRKLVEAFGFELKRVNGSHHIFAHPDVQELINVQDANGQAKPYQIRQFLRLVERYSLRLEDDA
jgi:predicted RNA binding protein YcfA (HicA-like mRNA interferase family)